MEFDEKVKAADKVVIGGNWYARVDGALVCGPISREGGIIELDNSVEVDFHSIDADGVRVARRAEKMLIAGETEGA